MYRSYFNFSRSEVNELMKNYQHCWGVLEMALDGEIKKPGNQARICYQPPPIKKWSLYFHPRI